MDPRTRSWRAMLGPELPAWVLGAMPGSEPESVSWSPSWCLNPRLGPDMAYCGSVSPDFILREKLERGVRVLFYLLKESGTC